jgi:hypothetical protein
MGDLVLKLFRLNVMVRGSLRSRFLERGIEKRYRDLGEFVYMHAHHMEMMEEGDLVLMDLMRNEIVRLSEEMSLIRKHDLKMLNHWDNKSGREGR